MTQQSPPSSPGPRVSRIVNRGGRTSPWLRWCLAAPAIIAIVSSLALASLLLARPVRPRFNWYERSGDAALADNNFPLAIVCYQRLRQISPADPRAAFKLAISLSRSGRTEEARQLFAGIAPIDRPGFAPAQLFVAEQLATAPAPTAAALAAADKHLAWAEQQLADGEHVHAIHAIVCYRQGDWANFRKQWLLSGSWQGQVERWLHTPSP